MPSRGICQALSHAVLRNLILFIMKFTCSWGGTWFSADIVNSVVSDLLFMVNMLQDLIDSWSCVVPWSVILMFFLNPIELGYFVLLENVVHLDVREGSKLFHTNDSDTLSVN